MFLLSCGLQLPFPAGFKDLCPAHTCVLTRELLKAKFPSGTAQAATTFYRVCLYISTDASLWTQGHWHHVTQKQMLSPGPGNGAEESRETV